MLGSLKEMDDIIFAPGTHFWTFCAGRSNGVSDIS
jgi:hypothetical protein